MIRKPINKFTNLVMAAAVCVALALSAAIAPRPAQAAVQNYPLGTQVAVIPLHLTGTISATTAAVAKFNMPFPCKMVGVGAVPRALTGSSNTLDVLLGGTSILSAPIAMTAGTYTEGTITTSAITDEGVITVNLAIPSGSLTDTTVILTCVRR